MPVDSCLACCGRFKIIAHRKSKCTRERDCLRKLQLEVPANRSNVTVWICGHGSYVRQSFVHLHMKESTFPTGEDMIASTIFIKRDSNSNNFNFQFADDDYLVGSHSAWTGTSERRVRHTARGSKTVRQPCLIYTRWRFGLGSE